jgi:pimeloyl-ACP methyl ester carboxylesterase
LFELGVGPAAFIGSSRGGVLTMLLGTAHPASVAAVVLHDVGPVQEITGMQRIKSYLGKLPHPRTHEEGAEMLRELMSEQFPKLTWTQWLGAAHRTWHSKPGGLKPAYDLGIARALASIDIDRLMPPLWHEFDALAGVADAGYSRRQFRFAFRGDGRGNAHATQTHGHHRSPGSGPCAAA